MTETQTHPDGLFPVEIDIACPDCDYNLRGLPGPVVDCPECGLTTDVPVLAARRWNKPWYQAPGFNRLLWPAATATIAWMASIFLMASDSANDLLLVSVCIICVLTLWVFLMIRAARLLNGWTGFWLALVAHGLVAGYLVGIIGLFTNVILGILALMDIFNNTGLLMYGAWSAVFALLLWVCRRIERAIAGVCIRHHLRRKPTG